jgi:hypothetical protein
MNLKTNTMKNLKITTVAQAINAIVNYNTLPPQIDYRAPQGIKSIEAEKYLESISDSEKQKAFSEIERQIDEYYTPAFTGEDGVEYSCADMDAMF